MRGYNEKGNIDTPLELAMKNQIDRFNLVIDLIDRLPKLGAAAALVRERMKNAILDNMQHAFEHGADRIEVAEGRGPH